MNITLYSAAEALRGLLDQIDPEDGTMPEGFEDARAIVATKATAVAAYVIETERQADYLKAHAKEVLDRAKAAEKRAAWLRQYLMTHMSACGITKISDERGLFSATLERERDKSVEVFDAAQIPADYMRVIKRVEPDKTLIKEAIELGDDVPGARIVARDRLTLK